MRIYTTGAAGCFFSSGKVTQSDFEDIQEEYNTVSEINTESSVILEREIPALFDHHSNLILRHSPKSVCVGIESHDGFISIFDPDYNEWKDCFIDPALKFINFERPDYESREKFLEENVIAEDYSVWEEFLPEI